MEEVVNFKIDVTCDKCGSENVFIPEADAPSDLIVCNSCGAQHGTRAALDEQIKEKVEKQIADQFNAMLSNAFDGNPFIKVTKG